MPEPRRLMSVREGGFDDPPASSDPPYPNRHSRLRRALRNTSDLAREVAAEVSAELGENWNTAPDGNLRRTWAQIRHVDNGGSRRRPRGDSGSDDISDDETGHGSHFTSGTPSGTEPSHNRRFKRRKLNTSPPPGQRQPIKYGHFGQVAAGRLRLEIVSCDGGEHTDARHPEIYLGSSNILRNDKTVYCSERSSANVVLRHADDTPFTLEKLHIVGPEHGFTSPVRGGLVYVSMTLHDLQKHLDPPFHARRAGIDTPPYHPRSRAQRQQPNSPERLTLADALQDPLINAAADFPARPNDDYAARADAAHDFARSMLHLDSSDDDTDPQYCPQLSATSTQQGLDPTALITVVTDDEASGPEDSSSQEVLDYRLQRLRLMRRRYEIEHWDRDDRWGTGIPELGLDQDLDRDRDGNWWLSGFGRQGGAAPQQDGDRRDHIDTSRLNGLRRLIDSARRNEAGYDLQPPPMGSAPVPSAPVQSAQPRSPDSPETTIYRGPEPPRADAAVTTARFHIKQGRHKVSLRFDPPVSGRFLLLKLWAGNSEKGNVDVQSVIAKGYGGCRFFPAIELR